MYSNQLHSFFFFFSLTFVFIVPQNFDPEAIVIDGKGGDEENTDHAAHNNNVESGGEDDDEDPDWNAIMKHEPARSDVPVFLHARDNYDAAKDKFRDSLDHYDAALKSCKQGLLDIPVKLYTQEDEKVRAMEENLKQGFIRNAEKRENIEENLKKSAEAAQGLFANLLMRVSTVTGVGGGGGRGN